MNCSLKEFKDDYLTILLGSLFHKNECRCKLALACGILNHWWCPLAVEICATYLLCWFKAIKHICYDAVSQSSFNTYSKQHYVVVALLNETPILKIATYSEIGLTNDLYQLALMFIGQ